MFSPKDVRGHSDSDFRWFNWRVPYREREHVGPLVLSMASLKEARAQESLSMYSSKDVRIEGTKKTGHRHFTWSAWHWCALVLSLGRSEFWTLWLACCYVGLSCILSWSWIRPGRQKTLPRLGQAWYQPATRADLATAPQSGLRLTQSRWLRLVTQRSCGQWARRGRSFQVSSFYYHDY